MIASFFLVFLIPSISVVAYYTFWASDQYVSKAQFTIAGGLPPVVDKITKLTGIPALLIVQDTLVVTNYLHSRAAVDAMDRQIDLADAYSSPKIDWLSRFDPKGPIEKLVNYWDDMSSISIKMPAGIVEIQVRAFSPVKARQIAAAAMKICDELINTMDDQIIKDAVTNAERQVAATSARLAQTRSALEVARNQTGIIDPAKTEDAAVDLLTGAKSALLQLQQQYQAQIRTIAANAPQMRVLRDRILATSQQVTKLQDQITRGKNSPKQGPVLSAATAQLNGLSLENKVAGKLYAGSLAALAAARLTAEHKMLYLATIEAPTLPQQALYPRRILMSSLLSGACLMVWALLSGFAIFLRNRAS